MIWELQSNRNVFGKDADGKDINQLAKMQNTVFHLPFLWKRFNVSDSFEASLFESLWSYREVRVFFFFFRGMNFMLKLQHPARLWPLMTLPVWEGSICIQNILPSCLKAGWKWSCLIRLRTLYLITGQVSRRCLLPLGIQANFSFPSNSTAEYFHPFCIRVQGY